MTRRVLVDHQHRVCFFWSPKCASRSLADWIYVNLMEGGGVFFLPSEEGQIVEIWTNDEFFKRFEGAFEGHEEIPR